MTYNRAQILDKILDSIEKYGWKYLNLIIVDNNSEDMTSQVIDKYQEKLKIRLIRSKENLGHGGGLALALDYLIHADQKPEYLIFLEDDSIPARELPDTLISQISNSEFSLLSPLGSIATLGKRTLIFPSPGEIKEVDFAVFDGAVMRWEVVSKVGIPVPDWFMMVDDYEYCYRIKQAGFKMGVIHNDFHQIFHLGAGSGFTGSSLWRGYYQERNYVFFVKKHFTLFNLADFVVFFGKRVFGSLAAPDRFQRIRLKFIGLWHGLINRKGRTLDPKSLRFNS
ncbi:glycosyltransferase family 2 protein [Algoriphagus sp.]|uniref:glycosyltransferase family 2 protein n=1 Tax=Algoriphagus sp. TaxID=1872435 RepID=UPI0027326094|nr:glycosyltransferase [Algoriphagus sp.]